MIDPVKIAELSAYGFGAEFSKQVLKNAQIKANARQETIYLCYDIDCIRDVYQSSLTVKDDVITFVEPQ